MELILAPEQIQTDTDYGPNQCLDITVKGFKGDPSGIIPVQLSLEVRDKKLHIRIWDQTTGDNPTHHISINPLGEYNEFDQIWFKVKKGQNHRGVITLIKGEKFYVASSSDNGKEYEITRDQIVRKVKDK